MTLDRLNALDSPDARAALERCCGSSRWLDRVLAARPFADREALFDAATRAEAAMQREDWLEAFAHHPRIGDLDALRTRFATTAAWAGAEQRGAASASDALLAELAEGNREYERRFGHRFIVCATGLDATTMLERLRARLGHDSAHELGVAAGEQSRIARLRLDKLLSAEES